MPLDRKYVSRAGEKLEFGLNHFEINVEGLICADFGASTGGFTDCLLKHGAARVYAVDTAYGELDWGLRNDSRVIVLERTNVLDVSLPENPDFICSDLGWTRQKVFLPKALSLLNQHGVLISLIKPHYESPKKYLQKGLLKPEYLDEVLGGVLKDITDLTLDNYDVSEIIESPVLGDKAKNREFLIKIRKK